MTTSIFETAQNFPSIIYAFIFCIGACMGSFLNVCVFRLQRGMSIVSPPSHCECGKPIVWYDNIPVISWFVLRGRARCCNAKLSIIHPVVEFLTGAVFLGMWIQLPAPQAVIAMLFSFIMIFCAFYDIDTMTLPDFATVGGAILGVAVAAIFPQYSAPELDGAPLLAQLVVSIIRSLVGIVVGSGTLYWIRLLSGYVFRREAMGEGDVILIGCIGAFCGWQGALFSIFIGSLIGAFIMIPVVLISSLLSGAGKKDKNAGENAESSPTAIPFGPWLALGAILYTMFFTNATNEYFSRIAEALFGV